MKWNDCIDKKTKLKLDWLNVARKLLTQRGFIDPRFQLSDFEYDIQRMSFFACLYYMAGMHNSATIVITIHPDDFEGKPVEDVADMVACQVANANSQLIDFLEMKVNATTSAHPDNGGSA